MYAARLVVVFLLILAVVVAYSPAARQSVVQAWDNIKPDLVQFIDSFYAAIRDLLVSHGSQDRIENAPTPDANFQRVITVKGGFVF